MGEQETSPVPAQATSPVIKKAETMDLPDAIRKVKEGKKITKLEWKNRRLHCILMEGFVRILDPKDNKLHPWNISEGDLMGKDWIVID